MSLEEKSQVISFPTEVLMTGSQKKKLQEKNWGEGEGGKLQSQI